MQIKTVHLKGFRNFKDEIVYFSKKSLIIGSNDIGKSNLLYALRILLDKSLSDAELELPDSDFYVHEDTKQIEITIEFEDVSEECVLARLREYVSPEGRTIIRYQAFRDTTAKEKYQFFIGKDLQSLKDIQTRFYLRCLNLKFIGTKRDLFAYIRGEKNKLLDDSRQRRTPDEIAQDEGLLAEIEKGLHGINTNITQLTYINKATESLNSELTTLSHHHSAQSVTLSVDESDPTLFVGNLHLASRVNGKNLTVGGDGRNSQIHLALWSARNKTLLEDGEPMEVNIFSIEEPETHLHPHQQRRLAKYLAETLESQVIITTHSPQIACEFPPSSIIHLHRCEGKPETKAAPNSNDTVIEDAFIRFGHRLNIIPAEAFFSTVVFLVEGPSEVLFYKALASAIDIDLDRLNISVLMVDGIGLKPYIKLFTALKIPYVIRTDNDICKIPYRDGYRYAGVQRAIDLCRDQLVLDGEAKALLQEESKLSNFRVKPPPPENSAVAQQFTELLQRFNIYMAEVDLETDIQKHLKAATAAFYGEEKDEDIVAEMQKFKATNMFKFLCEHSDTLKELHSTSLAKPLFRCKQIIEEMYATTNPGTTKCD